MKKESSSLLIRVTKKYESINPFLYNFKGKVINLHGTNYIKEVPVSPSNTEAKQVVYKAATQEELSFIFNEALEKGLTQDFLSIDLRK